MKNAITKTRAVISNWLKRASISDKPERSKPKQKKTPSEKKPPAPNVLSEIETALTQLQKEGGIATAGRVQVIRFDKLREELGNKWQRYSDRIERIIDSSINSQLSEKDLHWKIGNHAHVLVFTSVTPAEAEIKCGLIRAQVEDYFKGTPQIAGMIQVETSVAAIDGGIQLQSIADLDTLYSRLNLTEKPNLPDKNAKGEPDQKEAPINWTKTEDNITAAQAKFRTLDFLKQPVWDTTRKQIKCRAITPRDTNPNCIGRAGSTLTEWSGGAMTFALDEAMIAFVCKEQSKQSIDENQLIWFQTHFGSYDNSKFRTPLTKAWRRLDEARAPSQVVEIIGLPKRLQSNHSMDVIYAASRNCGQKALCLDLLTPQISLLKDGNANWAGFSMRDTKLSENAALDAIAKFAACASDYNVKLYAREISSKNLVTAAIGFGIRYIFANHEELNADNTSAVFRIEDLFIPDSPSVRDE